MRTNEKCALVLDGHSRAAVETLQALGRHGVQVDIAAERECVAFHSRYARQRLTQPPARAPHLLAAWLLRQDALWHYGLIVPSTEFSLQAFRMMPDESPLRKKSVLPGNESLDIALNKNRTSDLATKLGIAVPRSVLIESPSKLPPVERYPVVLKPVQSTQITPESIMTLAPVIARNESDRETTLEKWLPFVSVQQQEYILGHGLGIEFLFHRGRRLWHFAHERIHEYPLTGGGSTYRRSVHADAELLKQSERLLATLQWNGVAMVEFKARKDGTFYLMEINPRLWGSLALSIDAGMNFPVGLWRIANNETLPAQPNYRTNYYARDLVNDLQWQTENLRADHRDALLLTKPRACSLLEYLRPLLGKESWDHFDVGDPNVTAEILSTISRRYFNSLRSNIRRRRAESKSVAMHRRAMRLLSRRTSSVRSLLFLCYGNICRSQLAERLAKQVLTNLRVESAGLHAQEGQGSPKNIVCAANKMGIDLVECFSRCLTTEQVERADLIFVMDTKNHSDLIRSYPDAADRTLLLGLFLDRPAVNIADPYRASEEQTWEVATQIRAAINALARQLHKGLPNQSRPDIRKVIKAIAGQLFHRAGGLELVRRKNRHAARILMYHRFRDAGSLEAQCVHLRERYTPISLRALAEHLRLGRAFPPHSVAITVDDGYRDFLDVAFPIFSKYGIPVTVFLVTDFVDRKVWLWTDLIRYTIERTSLNQAEMELPNGRQLSLQFDSPSSRLHAAKSASEEAKKLANHHRVSFIDRLRDQLQVALPAETPETYRPLSWEEVRNLAQAGVEFGAHTRTHPILSRISDTRELREEIAGSKVRIEQELNAPVLHFCYPNGRADDIHDGAVAAVREAGFQTAVTTEGGLNSRRSNRLLLQRIGVEPNLSELYFQRCVAGLRV